jgi:hypothetical protein
LGSFEPEAEPPSEIGKILFAFAAGFVRMPFKVLDHFYPKVSSGGFVIIDDYTMPTCKAAMDDFRAKHSIHSPITTIECLENSGASERRFVLLPARRRN